MVVEGVSLGEGGLLRGVVEGGLLKEVGKGVVKEGCEGGL